MPFLQSLGHFCREDRAISSKIFLWPDFWSLRPAGHFRQERRKHLNQSIELKTDVLTQVCLTCILGFFVLFCCLMLILLQAFLFKKKKIQNLQRFHKAELSSSGNANACPGVQKCSSGWEKEQTPPRLQGSASRYCTQSQRHSKALKPWQSTGGKQVSSTNKSWGTGLL